MTKTKIITIITFVGLVLSIIAALITIEPIVMSGDWTKSFHHQITLLKENIFSIAVTVPLGIVIFISYRFNLKHRNQVKCFDDMADFTAFATKQLNVVLHDIQQHTKARQNKLRAAETKDYFPRVKGMIDKKLDKYICNFAGELNKRIREAVENYISYKFHIKENIRVVYKLIQIPLDVGGNNHDGKNIRDGVIYNSVWDMNTWYDSEKFKIEDDDRPSKYSIADYAAAYALLKDQSKVQCNDEPKVFLSNNLLDDEKRGAYINPSSSWKKRYNAKLITPVWTANLGDVDLHKKPFIYGFLSLDCKNESKKNIFSDDKTDFIYKIMQLASNHLAIMTMAVSNMENTLAKDCEENSRRVRILRTNERRYELEPVD